MKKIIILLVGIILLLDSCSTTKKATRVLTPVATETASTKVVERQVLIHDTVFVEIPAQQAERTTRDSVSFLETDYAASTARINLDGTLYHVLKNKAQRKPVQHDTPVITKDSLVYVNKETPVPYPVERELTLWEALSIQYFKWLLPLFASALVWIFRKPVMALIRSFI
jgi:hypothetical protein